MFSLTRSLLILAVVALLQSASAVPRKIGDECATVSRGTQEGFPHTLRTVYIPPGQQAASIDVPKPCSGNVLGEQATACDDVAPTVIVPDPPNYTPVTVYRNGNYYGQAASVTITVWCDTPYG